MCLAVPGRITAAEARGSSRVGRVDFGGIVREALLDLVPEAEPGDFVLVHVGVAISRIDEDEARKTIALLREAGIAIEDA